MLRFRSIRSRLTVTFLLAILAVMLIVGFFLDQLIENYYIKSREDNLVRSGTLAGRFVAGQLKDQVDPVRLSWLAENFGRQMNARVIFVNRKGIVIGDSVIVGGLLGQLLDRDELTAAFAGEKGISIQYSELSKQKVMQVALPVQEEEEGEPVGAVFLSASLQEIDQIIADIRGFLTLATLLAAALTGIGAVFLARRFTGPLELLTEAAGKMAEGKLEQRIPVKSEDEIGRLARQFNLMAEQLNYYTKIMRNFVANVAHELRTPLASLSLLIKSLKDYEMETEQRQEFLDDLDHEMDRLIALVRDLLELTTLEAGETRREHIALDELIRDLIKQALPRFDRQDIRLLSDLPAGEYMVAGSSLQLRQVLHNLLENALKYTSPGGWVKVTLWREEEAAGVKVEDTGCGIPEKDLPFIFERFFRVDRARSREMGGTGLGLAIVKETVEAHGGRVWVESKEGEGSAFYFTLPLLRQDVNNY
jgi:signal transduction histidine kinase